MTRADRNILTYVLTIDCTQDDKDNPERNTEVHNIATTGMHKGRSGREHFEY